MKKCFFVLILFCVYVFSSCAVVGYDTSAKFDSGYFTEEGSYVLNCKGINDLAAACKINLTDIDSVTSLTLKYIDHTNIKVISKFKNLRELTIINSDLADKDISFLPQTIESLTLSSCKNVDYTQIPHTVSALSLHHVHEDIDLNAVSEMDNITSLSLTYSNIARQSDLSLLTQLTSLEVIGNMGSDEMLIMSCISDLTNLKALKIYDLYCTKFDAISNLKQLEELSFTNSSNVSYEALSALTKLKILDTTDHSLYDHVINSSDVFFYVNKYHMNEDNGFISAIENMPDLKILKCKGYPSSKIKACKNLKEAMFVCDTVDLNDFDGLNKLEKLSVAANDIVPSKTKINIKEFEYCDTDAKGDLSFIGDFAELERLMIKYDNIHGIGMDMSYIGNCTKLKSLSISDYHYTHKEAFDISFISALKDLEELCIEDIIIQNIKPISNLYDLKALTLSGCSLCNIEILSNLKLLQYIDLSRNMISDISPLENLKCASHLELQYNNISQISPLSNLNDIKYLDISCNQVKDINAIENFKDIEYLNLLNNGISDLTSVSGKNKLRYLDISFNNIDDSAWANDLNSLEKLTAYRFMTTDLDFLYNFPSILEVEITYSFEVIDYDHLEALYLAYKDTIPMCKINIDRDSWRIE